jgi:hypothetical protein
LSHYPVYVKDHLYNTNPTFDYGAFTQLAYYVTQTNVTLGAFAHTFDEAGTFVFRDSQNFDWWVFISRFLCLHFLCKVSRLGFLPEPWFIRARDFLKKPQSLMR